MSEEIIKQEFLKNAKRFLYPLLQLKKEYIKEGFK